MPKMGTPHANDPNFVLVSISGGELIYKFGNRVLTESEVKVRAATKGADAPKRDSKAKKPVAESVLADVASGAMEEA